LLGINVLSVKFLVLGAQVVVRMSEQEEDVKYLASDDVSKKSTTQIGWEGERRLNDSLLVALIAGWIASTSKSKTICTGVGVIIGVNTLYEVSWLSAIIFSITTF